MIDRAGLAEFLRNRREALQPEDVGLPRGPRRRTNGLRREEVASLCHMSADYYSRLERERGPQPSHTMLALVDPGQAHSLMVYTATPGSESYEKLQIRCCLSSEHRRFIDDAGKRSFRQVIEES